jgi:C-terminal processing protease CtpA/Prc
MTKIAAFLLMLIIFCAKDSLADMLDMKDGRQIKGVVLRDGPDRVLFSGVKGEEDINKLDIAQISYDTEEENLLSLADNAFQKREYAKALYLYEKTLRLNPGSERAIRGMKKTEPYAYSKGKAVDYVADYQRYQGPAKSKEGAEKVLLQNSQDTEKVQRGLGIILAVKTKTRYYNKLRVADVFRDSRADKAGLQVGDGVVSINGYLTDYMGLFDAVSVLAKNISGKIDMIIEREIPLWADKTMGASLPELVGFSIDASPAGFIISDINKDSNTKNSGLKIGDLIVLINGNLMQGKSIDEASKFIMDSTPGHIDIVIRRRVTT